MNPQFWAEDGRVWFADAYNRGIAYSLLTPEAGYFQTFSRLVAVASQAVPLAFAPLFFNLAAIGVQVITALFIISPRMARAVPNAALRLLIAFIYLALPHSSEVFANVTNSQWHLALLAFLVIVAEPSEKTAWRVFDIAAILLSALTGPFCLLLLPAAAVEYYQRREKWKLTLLALLAAGAMVQTAALVTHERPSQAELGASVSTFFRITARHLFISPIIGGRGFSGLAKADAALPLLSAAANVAGFGLFIYCFLKARLELRLLIIFSALIFSASLISPAVSPDVPQWVAIASDNTALRYWFIPNLCLFVCLIFIVSRPNPKPVRVAAGAVLAASLLGITADWRNPPFKDLHFGEYAARFEAGAAGTEYRIPINPAWEMTLIKK